MSLTTTLGGMEWSAAFSKSSLLDAEKYVCTLQGALGSGRLRHEVRIATSQAEAMRERIPLVVDAELESSQRNMNTDSEAEWLALLDQRTPAADLFAVTDVPELKVWDIVRQVHDTLSRSESLYGERLHSYMHPKCTELIGRVSRLIPRTKIHSVELSNIVSNSLSQAVRFTSTPSFEERMKEVCVTLGEHTLQAAELQQSMETALQEGNTEEAEEHLKARLEVLREMLELVSCKYDAITSHREQMVNNGRVEIEQVWGAAVHEAERLLALSSIKRSNVDEDTHNLNIAMAAIIDKDEAMSKTHTQWVTTCDQRLHELRVKSDEAWDRVHEQEALLKTCAEERLQLLKDRQARIEEEQRRCLEKRHVDKMFTERSNLLKLNKSCMNYGVECYKLCSEITDDVKAKLDKLLVFVSSELERDSKHADAEYDSIFRKMYNSITDLIYRKNALVSSLTFEIDNASEADKDFNVDRALSRVKALKAELHDLEVQAKASLLLYERLVGHRLKESLGDAYIPPQTDSEQAIVVKRVKLKHLAEEQRNDKASKNESQNE